MGNLKHTIAALAAVSLVGSLSAVQLFDFSAVRATKLTQETEIVEETPEVLVGDGEGETVDFSIMAPALQIYAGSDGYILTSGGSINLRAAADIESTILDVLEVGTQVKIIDVDEDWFKVETATQTGYVKSEFVSLDYGRVEDALLKTVMYREGKAVQSVNVRGTADENSLILDQIGEGEDVIILEITDNNWCKVYFGKNYDIGYVSAQYISAGNIVKRKDVAAKRNSRLAEVAKAAKITSSGKNIEVKTLPSEECETITTLSDKVNCKVISGGTNWTKIIVSATNEIGYVKTANVSVIAETKAAVAKPAKASKSSAKTTESTKSSSASSGGSKLLAEASKYIGTRYVYGGTSPSGFDCSGLVQYSLRKLGVSIGRSASSQYSSGVGVSRNNLQPGDLVFFSRGGGISHVAIYAGNGQVLHAPRAGKSVCYQSLSSLTGSLKYVGAKRVM